VEELRPGLWTWAARHPDWTPKDGGPEGWGPDVRSYAYDAGQVLVLFDPMSPDSTVLDLTQGQDVVVLLTVPWHRRSAGVLHEELGATLYAPEGGEEELDVPARRYRLGDTLPGTVEPKPGAYANEAVLWIPEHRALVIGEVLQGEGGLRLLPESWLPAELTPEALRDRLRPLVDLPVELVLPTHGDPVTEGGREALARALAE